MVWLLLYILFILSSTVRAQDLTGNWTGFDGDANGIVPRFDWYTILYSVCIFYLFNFILYHSYLQ